MPIRNGPDVAIGLTIAVLRILLVGQLWPSSNGC